MCRGFSGKTKGKAKVKLGLRNIQGYNQSRIKYFTTLNIETIISKAKWLKSSKIYKISKPKVLISNPACTISTHEQSLPVGTISVEANIKWSHFRRA